MYTIFAGGIGGVTLWTLMFPFDVVKSRMQVTGQGSLVGLLVHIVRHEGIS
jgi:solute carrier family 25 ornithine transporter 2/15